MFIVTTSRAPVLPTAKINLCSLPLWHVTGITLCWPDKLFGANTCSHLVWVGYRPNQASSQERYKQTQCFSYNKDSCHNVCMIPGHRVSFSQVVVLCVSVELWHFRDVCDRSSAEHVHGLDMPVLVGNDANNISAWVGDMTPVNSICDWKSRHTAPLDNNLCLLVTTLRKH